MAFGDNTPMNRELERLQKWIHLMQQIHEATYYVSRAVELGRPEQFRSLGGILEFLAYFRAAVNSYAKCFVSAGSGRISLDPSGVYRGDPDNLARHKRLMELRHKYVAHSDGNEIEASYLDINETDSELTIGLRYALHFPFDRLYDVRDVIQHVEEHVVERHYRDVARIERRLGKPIRIRQGDSPID